MWCTERIWITRSTSPDTRWRIRHQLRTCPTQSQMHFDESIESIAADSDLEDGEIKKLLAAQLYAKELPGDRIQWSFRKERLVHKRLTYHRIRDLPGDRLHCFHQNVMNREAKRGVLCSETPMCRFWVKLHSKAIKITCWIEQERIQPEEKFMSSHSMSASMIYKKNGGTRHGITRRTKRICRISSRTN